MDPLDPADLVPAPAAVFSGQAMTAGLDHFDEAPPAPALLTPAARRFQGKPLAPYSFLRRVLSRAPIGEEPAHALLICATIFALTLSDAEAQEALCEVGTFRKKLFAWFDTLTIEEFKEADKLAEEITKEALKSEVRTVEEPATDPLKKNT